MELCSKMPLLFKNCLTLWLKLVLTKAEVEVHTTPPKHSRSTSTYENAFKHLGAFVSSSLWSLTICICQRGGCTRGQRSRRNPQQRDRWVPLKKNGSITPPAGQIIEMTAFKCTAPSKCDSIFSTGLMRSNDSQTSVCADLGTFPVSMPYNLEVWTVDLNFLLWSFSKELEQMDFITYLCCNELETQK